MIRIAFASKDHKHVDLHFGAAERILLYDVAPGWADLVGIGQFVKVDMQGENRAKGNLVAATGEAAPPPPAIDPALPRPDKVIPKLAFIEGCAAVYAVSIGASSIKRLMAAKIQPIIVEAGHDIEDLLNEVSLALVYGGLGWVDEAVARATIPPALPALAMGEAHHLMSSIDDLD